MSTTKLTVESGERFDCVATRSQRTIWSLYQAHYPDHQRLNVPLLFELSPLSKASIARVRSMLEKVITVNEAYRTRFSVNSQGRLHQIVPARESLPMVVLDVDSSIEGDDFAASCRKMNRKAIEPLEDPMVRIYLGVTTESVRFVFLEISHMAADAYGINLLEQTIQLELDGSEGRFSKIQPRHWSSWESSIAGESFHLSSLSQWREAFKITEDARVLPSLGHKSAPTHNSVTLTSSSFYSALDGLAKRNNCLPAAAFTATVAEVSNSYFLGDSDVQLPYTVWVSNRHQVPLFNAHGTYAQMAVVVERGRFRRQDNLPRFQRTYLKAMRTGGVDPDILHEYLYEMGMQWFQQGTVPPLPLRRVVNFVGGDTASKSASRSISVQHSSFGISGVYFNAAPSFNQVKVGANDSLIDEAGIRLMLEDLEHAVIGD